MLMPNDGKTFTCRTYSTDRDTHRKHFSRLSLKQMFEEVNARRIIDFVGETIFVAAFK